MKRISTLILSGALAAAMSLSAHALNYPIDVQYPIEGGAVTKTYIVSSEQEIEQLPRDSFVLGGIVYDYTDTICQIVASELKQAYTQTETIETDTKDTEKIKAQLEPTKKVTTPDGYSGVLSLREDTITTKATAWGYGSSTKTLTRSYPNLSAADINLLPKEVTSDGRTYTLADVSWSEGSVYNPYDEEVNAYYTASATYSSTKKTSWVKKYEVNAEYAGDLTKTTDEGYQCTLLFYPQSGLQGSTKGGFGTGGTGQTAAKQTASSTQAAPVESRIPAWAYFVGAILLVAAIGGCTYTFIDWKKKHSVE